MNRVQKKPIGHIIGQIVTIVLVVLIVLALVSIVTQRADGKKQITFLGWGAATILTGSMEPNIPVGSLILIHAQREYEVGDVVTFENGKTPVTHRIIATIGDEEVITKGDANNAKDKPIQKDQIVGKVVKVFPNGGKTLDFIRNPVFLGVVAAILVLIWVMPSKDTKRKYEDMKKVEEDVHVQE